MGQKTASSSTHSKSGFWSAFLEVPGTMYDLSLSDSQLTHCPSRSHHHLRVCWRQQSADATSPKVMLHGAIENFLCSPEISGPPYPGSRCPIIIYHSLLVMVDSFTTFGFRQRLPLPSISPVKILVSVLFLKVLISILSLQSRQLRGHNTICIWNSGASSSCWHQIFVL